MGILDGKVAIVTGASAEPRALTGRIAYSQDLLAELGVSAPAGR